MYKRRKNDRDDLTICKYFQTDTHITETKTQSKSVEFDVGEWMENRSKYIPLRLHIEERKFLRL